MRKVLGLGDENLTRGQFICNMMTTRDVCGVKKSSAYSLIFW